MSQLYIDCYERLTGQEFVPYTGDDLEAQIAASLEFFRPERLAALTPATIQVFVGSRSDLPQICNAYRFFKALPQITLTASIVSCDRNPKVIRQIAIDFGAEGHEMSADAIVAAAGLSARLASALKSWLVCLGKSEIPVFGVGMIGKTEEETQAARLAIEMVPGQPLEGAFMGQAGMFDALRAAAEGNFTVRTIKHKPYERDIQV